MPRKIGNLNCKIKNKYCNWKSKEMILIYDWLPLSSSWEETESPLSVQSLYQVSIHFKTFVIIINFKFYEELHIYILNVYIFLLWLIKGFKVEANLNGPCVFLQGRDPTHQVCQSRYNSQGSLQCSCKECMNPFLPLKN